MDFTQRGCYKSRAKIAALVSAAVSHFSFWIDGPIVGVYSKSPKKSILIMFGRERYDEWRFTEDVVTPGRQSIQGNPGVGNPDPGAVANMSLRWIGRPMRFFNQTPGGTLPGGGEGAIPDSNGRPNSPSNPRGQRGGTGGAPRGPR